MSVSQSKHTVKLSLASQPSTPSTTEDATSIAHDADVRAGSVAHAILLREHHDPAAVAGPDAGDSLRQEALEAVRTRRTGAVQSERDGRALVTGALGGPVRLLAGVLGLGRKGHVEAGDQVLGGRWVRADFGEAWGQGGECGWGAELGVGFGQAGLLDGC